MRSRTASAGDALSHAGQHLGYGDWLAIDQARIDDFADAAGDHQCIHVDPERAKDGPFGRCIARGYLTRSLVHMFLLQIMEVQNNSMGVNYGADKLRFPAPVGSRVRGARCPRERSILSSRSRRDWSI